MIKFFPIKKYRNLIKGAMRGQRPSGWEISTSGKLGGE
jgi:hypothetical protein